MIAFRFLFFFRPTEINITGPKGYFLIIDRLNETLGDLINRWKRETKHSPTAVSTIVGNVKELVGRKWRSGSDDLNEPIGSGDKGSAAKSIIEDQLDVGLQVSSALMYLHEKGIMFRDLKPANIGVDGEYVLCRMCGLFDDFHFWRIISTDCVASRPSFVILPPYRSSSRGREIVRLRPGHRHAAARRSV